ncbi:amino acid ABC transporter permease [Pseudoflavonifractor sp. 524-17]|uniref:amino acid ABC transporter permease n=1 Tax=Pseudoflavonifractor sp. 524-17 TaxID=2304577 RepID=UPI0013795153|nr:amino acid ABC transporter permease [Pseudoflavonifractor sp. 524-17]NCE65047.1 amino acid ABC transporter permease [Pseudoflavonifractor sp. 524-17]
MEGLTWLNTFGTKFYKAFLFEDRWRLYLNGLGATLSITLGAILISTVFGMVLCLMKISKYPVLRGPAKAYIDIIRGIPVVVQLLIIYNVVLVGVNNKIVIAVIAFGINSSAYMAEIYRSGINAVDQGQMEAGRSLGLTQTQTMWHIIFPQALKNCLPTYTSEFIVLVKETAVVGYIGLMDLTKVYSSVQGMTYDAMAPLLIIAVAYFCITKVLAVIFARMERRLRQSDKR